jgi:APA family basic amino acid/polyamine antiporter
MGIQEGKWIQRIFTIAKFLALMLIVFGALYFVLFPSTQTPTFTKFNFDSNFSINQWNIDKLSWENIKGYSVFIAFGAAMVGSLFSADAWQGITFMSTEVKSPIKNIPKALVFGTTLVTLVYVLVNFSYMVLLPLKGIPSQNATIYDLGISHAENNRVGAAAASAILGVVNNPQMGYLGMAIMAMFILISTFGCNNGLILSGSRLFKAMSDEGLFFNKARKLNKKGTPGNALWMQATWAAILCLSGSYESLLNYCTFASLLFYIVTVIGLIVLRIKEPMADRPYKVWGYPYIPITYIILAGSIAIAILLSNFTVSMTGLGIVLLGWPIYYLFNSKIKSGVVR